MKTATEVLTEIHPKPVNGELEYAWVIQAMKVYGNQKIDQALAEFERLKPVESVRDILYLDGVKAVLSTLKDQI